VVRLLAQGNMLAQQARVVSLRAMPGQRGVSALSPADQPRLPQRPLALGPHRNRRPVPGTDVRGRRKSVSAQHTPTACIGNAAPQVYLRGTIADGERGAAAILYAPGQSGT
jgi:hypothetical protein